MTEGFLYLSFSGKVAGRSLNMTGSGILASHYFRSLLDQLPPSNWLLQHIESAEFENGRLHQCIGVSRNHQDRNRRTLAPQFNQQVDSRFVRHPVVADDEVEMVQSERFKRSIHVLCRLDRVALSFQNLLTRIPAGLVVVRD